jgi:hypothetical protein
MYACASSCTACPSTTGAGERVHLRREIALEVRRDGRAAPGPCGRCRATRPGTRTMRARPTWRSTSIRKRRSSAVA